MVAGATGLVGREILAALLADKTYASLHVVGRRPVALQHPKLIQHVVDFAALPTLPQVDDCFIALGTTIKLAGSREAFRAIDFKAVEVLAHAVRAQGATKLGVVSAMGANPQSPIFYNRVKGEMEDCLAHMGFSRLVIARPSLLDGQRQSLQQAPRPAERLGLAFMRCVGPLIPRNYRSINASDVARALVQSVQSGASGLIILKSGDMQPR